MINNVQNLSIYKFVPIDQLGVGTSTNYGYGIDRKDPYVDVFQWKRVGLPPEGRPLPDTGKLCLGQTKGRSRSSSCRMEYTGLVS